MFNIFLRVHVPRRTPRQSEGAAILAGGRRHPGEVRTGEASPARQAAVPHGHRVRDAGRAGGVSPRPRRHAHPVPPHLREDPWHGTQGHDLQVRSYLAGSSLICIFSETVTQIMRISRLMYRGAAYADSLQYQHCINLWKYALELRVAKDSILFCDTCFTAQVGIVSSLCISSHPLASWEKFLHLLRSFGLLRWATNFTYLKEIWSPSYVLLYIFAVLNELKNGFSSAQKFDVLYTYLFQALVKLFLDRM